VSGASVPERARLASLVRLMLLARRFDERLIDLYKADQIPGWLHPHIGQEGVAVGVIAQLREDDLLICGHRSHAHLLAKGVSPRKLAAEILGRVDGLCGGRGGEVHLADVDRGCVQTTGIVGQQLPIALGAAFRIAYAAAGDRIAVCVFGDGAVGEGVAHEALNLAAILKVPLLLVCENNGYSVGTRADLASPGGDIARWAASYGIPTYQVDGCDVLGTDAVAREAVERTRLQAGPVFLECRVVRQLGHHMGDAQVYRAAEEIEAARQADVLPRFLAEAVQHGIDTAEVAHLEADVEREVTDAIEFALASAHPSPSTLEEMLWAGDR